MRGSRQNGRLNFMIMLKENEIPSMSGMAGRLGVTLATLDNWSAIYRGSGLKGLLAPETRGKGSKLISGEVHEALRRRVEDPNDGFRGYWDAHQWVQEEFGIRISYNWLREYMREKFKTRLKMPRKSNVKKDEKAVEVFKKPQNHL
ncbi:winged helix-turn-helix domain-containing protein [Maribacter sp. 2307ULW6-5]|uniref:winged helix-turn-helix domain-containing protein n=1 Tax=Maribacter sp. 2307ULW6-5 TaxID=3386275 RepID=UPI0039BC5C8C